MFMHFGQLLSPHLPLIPKALQAGRCWEVGGGGAGEEDGSCFWHSFRLAFPESGQVGPVHSVFSFCWPALPALTRLEVNFLAA